MSEVPRLGDETLFSAHVTHGFVIGGMVREPVSVQLAALVAAPFGVSHNLLLAKLPLLRRKSGMLIACSSVVA